MSDEKPGLLEVLAVPAMIGLGALVALQSDVNGELAHELGTGLRAGALAAVVSFGSGLVVLAAIVLGTPRHRHGTARMYGALRDGELRTWQMVGGAAGALLVASQGIAVGTIGVALFIVAVVAGQTTTGLGVDHLGLGPSGRQAVTAGRVVGAGLTLVAVVVSVSDRLGGSGALTGPALALCLLPLAAGAGTSWQQAVNGRVSQHGGPLAAALNNFVVGTTLLALLLLVSFAFPGDLAGSMPSTWYLYVGGLIGVVFISAAALLVKVHGVLVLGLCTVAGQVVTSQVLQAVTGEHLGVATVVGGVVALVGVAVGAWASRRGPSSARRPEHASSSAAR